MDLPLEHIRVGNFIWYSGSTSMFSWSCPAQIVKINEAADSFQVMSLDDMAVQDQWYSFEVREHSPESRKTMRAITPEEIKPYVKRVRLNHVYDAERFELKATAAREAADKATRFLEELTI